MSLRHDAYLYKMVARNTSEASKYVWKKSFSKIIQNWNGWWCKQLPLTDQITYFTSPMRTVYKATIVFVPRYKASALFYLNFHNAKLMFCTKITISLDFPLISRSSWEKIEIFQWIKQRIRLSRETDVLCWAKPTAARNYFTNGPYRPDISSYTELIWELPSNINTMVFTIYFIRPGH